MAEPTNKNYSNTRLVVEVISLIFVTLTQIVVFITSGLSWATNASKFGFINRTGAVYDKFYTQITPAGFTFSIWGVIYTWDILWILYAWSFVFRPNMQRTMCIPMFWIRTFINCLNITWIYVWGNEKVVAACVILYIIAFSFYLSNTILVVYFFSVQNNVNRVDKVLTYILPLNGMFVYSTWATVASQLNLVITISYTTSFGATDSATVGLTLLLVLVFVYFILESTIASQYLQYVYSVYPVIIWANFGVVAAHWKVQSEGSRNKIYVMIIMIIATLFLFYPVHTMLQISAKIQNRVADGFKEKG